MSVPCPNFPPLRLLSVFVLNAVAALPSTALVLRVYNDSAHLRMNGFPATPTINPTFLNPGGGAANRLDLTGVGWSVQDPTKQFTLVSLRHFVGANHFRPEVGSTVRFLASDNSLHTFTIATLYSIPNPDNSPSDVFLGEFTADVPAAAGILPLPYLNLATEAAYVGQALVVAGQAARGGRGTIATVSDFGGDPITGGAGIKTRALTFNYGPVGTADDAHAEVGDSGSPSFAVRANKAALVGTHTAVANIGGTTTTFDTLVPHYAPQLDALMESTGFHLRKINPAATSLAASGSVSGPPSRTGKPFTYRFAVTNGSAAADNLAASFDLPPGLAISGISAAGWQATAEGTLRRGGLAAGATSNIDVTFSAAPAAGTISISLSLKSDGSAPQTYPFQLTVLPSFAAWATGLDDATVIGDSDGDGIKNLLEYAFGGDNATSSQSFPSGTAEDLLLPVFLNNPSRLTYFRRTDASSRGLLYRLETSPDLRAQNWTTLDNVSISTSPAPAAGFEKVQASLGTTTAGVAFYRLRIELAE